MHRFFGLWTFDAAASDLGDEPPPTRAVYALWPAREGVLAGAVSWMEAEGEALQAAFELVPDGALRDLPDGGQLRTTLSDGALVSEILRGGEVVHAEIRSVDESGALTVVQRAVGAETRAVYRRDRVKQVLCYRRDLKMRKGKIAAQCAHASQAVFLRPATRRGLELVVPLTPEMALWSGWRSAKIVLSVDSEEHLLAVYEAARERGVPTALVRDAGLTEFKGVPTLTAVAVGPATDSEIDPITGPNGQVPTRLA